MNHQPGLHLVIQASHEPLEDFPYGADIWPVPSYNDKFSLQPLIANTVDKAAATIDPDTISVVMGSEYQGTGYYALRDYLTERLVDRLPNGLESIMLQSHEDKTTLRAAFLAARMWTTDEDQEDIILAITPGMHFPENFFEWVLTCAENSTASWGHFLAWEPYHEDKFEITSDIYVAAFWFRVKAGQEVYDETEGKSEFPPLTGSLNLINDPLCLRVDSPDKLSKLMSHRDRSPAFE